MSKKNKRILVVLEEGIITSMATDPRFTAEFTFLVTLGRQLRHLGPTGPSCNTCGSAAKERSTAFGAAKRAFAGLDSDKKRKLKDMLNAKQVRVTYPLANGNGRKELTF